MDNFESYLEQSLKALPTSKITEAMQYSLMAGGKRIRPKLLFASLHAYGKKEEIGYGAAAAIEMIHTYSLIHDDLPAMDNDTLRRGKPTCHVKYGEAAAILAGDGLLTQAFLEIAQIDVDANAVKMMCTYLSDYSGANGMVHGQILDLEGEVDPTVSLEQLQEIHFYKTGKLLTLPLLFAAILAGHSEDVPIWKEVGRYIGLSFQIQDDVLDVTSSTQVLGKNIYSDAENNKQTYVTLLGVEKAQEKAQNYYIEAWKWLEKLSINKEAMKPVFEELTKRKH